MVNEIVLVGAQKIWLRGMVWSRMLPLDLELDWSQMKGSKPGADPGGPGGTGPPP